MRTTVGSSSSEEESEVRSGPWTSDEDAVLAHFVTRHGEGRWNALAKCAGLKRNGKSCRLRWLNYLKPDIKRGNLTPQEQLVILELHSKWGNRWSKIAQHLPGRTDNEIKNYWRTRVKKQARQLNIDPSSTKFLDTIRFMCIPRLLQEREQSSRPPLDNATTSSTSTSSAESGLLHHSGDFGLASTSTTPTAPPNLPSGSAETAMNNYANFDNFRSPLMHGETTHTSAMIEGFGIEDTAIQGFDFESEPIPVEDNRIEWSNGPCMVGECCDGNEMAYAFWNMDDLWQL